MELLEALVDPERSMFREDKDKAAMGRLSNALPDFFPFFELLSSSEEETNLKLKDQKSASENSISRVSTFSSLADLAQNLLFLRAQVPPR